MTKYEKILTPTFRVSFAHVFKPGKSFQGKEPKYSVTMLFEKSTDLTDMKKLVGKVIRAKWGDDKAKWPEKLGLPFKDGDKQKPEAHKGKVVIEARSQIRPGLVNQKCEEIINPAEFYSGCYARATVTCFAYEQMGNSGVAFGLQNIQKVKDGEAFSGRANAKDDFEKLAELDDNFETKKDENEIDF